MRLIIIILLKREHFFFSRRRTECATLNTLLSSLGASCVHLPVWRGRGRGNEWRGMVLFRSEVSYISCLRGRGHMRWFTIDQRWRTPSPPLPLPMYWLWRRGSHCTSWVLWRWRARWRRCDALFRCTDTDGGRSYGTSCAPPRRPHDVQKQSEPSDRAVHTSRDGNEARGVFNWNAPRRSKRKRQNDVLINLLALLVHSGWLIIGGHTVCASRVCAVTRDGTDDDV